LPLTLVLDGSYITFDFLSDSKGAWDDVVVKALCYYSYGPGDRSPVVSLDFSVIYFLPGSSVGTATAYGLDGPGIESRWGARFSAPVQTGPEAHPASCTMGTGFFQGVRCCRGVTLTPHPLLVPRSKIE